MGLVIKKLEARTRAAVKKYWKEVGRVRSGKTMDGFFEMMKKIVEENGLRGAVLQRNAKIKSIPGFFRPTKKWDLIITHQDALVAAIEFKSLGAKSAGKNLPNRCEEALGNSKDFWVALREKSFGPKTKDPFLGYIMLLEDSLQTSRTAKLEKSLFPVRAEFQNTSYVKRYELLCEKLMLERLYTSAALLLTTKAGGKMKGNHSEPNAACSFDAFARSLAAHVAQVASGKKKKS